MAEPFASAADPVRESMLAWTDDMRVRPGAGEGKLWRILPFGAVAVLATVAFSFGSNNGSDAASWMAIALAAVIVLSALFLPWSRWRAGWQAVPPLAFLVVVALLRHGVGGPYSGASVLVFLPVIWLMLYGTARQLALAVIGVGLVFAVPIVAVGGPAYPADDWKRAVLSMAVSALIAASGHKLVNELWVRSNLLRIQADELRQADQLSTTAIERAPIGIAMLDLDGRVTRVNKSFETLTQFGREEILTMVWSDLIRRDTSGSGGSDVENMLAGKRDQATGLGRYVRHDGQERWGSFSGGLVRDHADQPLYVILMLVDVTEEREIERIKDELVSVVSHELRTPLTSIRGSLGLLHAGVLGRLPPDADKAVTVALNSTDRMVRLVNDMLDVERIAAGKARIEIDAVEILELVQEAVDSVYGMADLASVDIGCEVDRATIWVDHDRIVQVLTNLLSNAIKHSSPGASVVLRAHVNSPVARFEVSDSGSGVPPELGDTIFDRFQQADVSDAREKGGTGLGLPIARGIVEMHGGSIGYFLNPGGGTTFYFTVPFMVKAPAHV